MLQQEPIEQLKLCHCLDGETHCNKDVRLTPTFSLKWKPSLWRGTVGLALLLRPCPPVTFGGFRSLGVSDGRMDKAEGQAQEAVLVLMAWQQV